MLAAVPYDGGFAKALKEKERQIIRLQDQILSTRDHASKLRDVHRHRFRGTLANNRSNSWKKAMALQRDPDALLRPPDRQMCVRLYTPMDNDLWNIDDLRRWFGPSKDSPIPTPSNFDGVASGYLKANATEVITKSPLNPSYQPPSAVIAKQMTTKNEKYDIRHPSPYLAWAEQAAGGRPIDTSPKPHWMDFESSLKEQQQESLRRMKERHLYPTDQPGHSPGCRKAPWKDRPIEEEDQGHSILSAKDILAIQATRGYVGTREQYVEMKAIATKLKAELRRSNSIFTTSQGHQGGGRHLTSIGEEEGGNRSSRRERDLSYHQEGSSKKEREGKRGGRMHLPAIVAA